VGLKSPRWRADTPEDGIPRGFLKHCQRLASRGFGELLRGSIRRGILNTSQRRTSRFVVRCPQCLQFKTVFESGCGLGSAAEGAPFPLCCFRSFSRLKAYIGFIRKREDISISQSCVKTIKGPWPHFAFVNLNNIRTYFLKHACRSRQRCSSLAWKAANEELPDRNQLRREFQSRQPPTSSALLLVNSPGRIPIEHRENVGARWRRGPW
jgi:hypothetical protein